VKEFVSWANKGSGWRGDFQRLVWFILFLCFGSFLDTRFLPRFGFTVELVYQIANGFFSRALENGQNERLGFSAHGKAVR